jgi:hypothetical protein
MTLALPLSWLSRNFGGVSEKPITTNFRLVQFRQVSESKLIAENLEPCGMRWGESAGLSTLVVNCTPKI